MCMPIIGGWDVSARIINYQLTIFVFFVLQQLWYLSFGHVRKIAKQQAEVRGCLEQVDRPWDCDINCIQTCWHKFQIKTWSSLLQLCSYMHTRNSTYYHACIRWPSWSFISASNVSTPFVAPSKAYGSLVVMLCCVVQWEIALVVGCLLACWNAVPLSGHTKPSSHSLSPSRSCSRSYKHRLLPVYIATVLMLPCHCHYDHSDRKQTHKKAKKKSKKLGKHCMVKQTWV